MEFSKKRQHGFTLVELMMAASLIGLAMLAISTFLVFDARTATKTQNKIEMARSATLAMEAIGTGVRKGERGNGDVFFDPGSLRLYFNYNYDRDHYVEWDVDQNQLVLVDPANNINRLILIDNQWDIRDFYAEEWSDNNNSSAANGTIYVHLQLRDTDSPYEIDLSCNFLPRNQEILNDSYP